MARAQMKPDLDEAACPWCGYASIELEELGVLHVVACDACEQLHDVPIEPFVLTLVELDDSADADDDADDEWLEEKTAEYEVPPARIRGA